MMTASAKAVRTQAAANTNRIDTTLSSGRTLLNRYATIATMVTYAIVAISGVMLFFHVGEGLVKGAHEWIGVAFVLAAVFHAIRHARSFTVLLSKPRTRWAILLGVIVTVAFVGLSALGGTEVNPRKQFVGRSLDAPISTLSPIVGTSTEVLLQRLAIAGVNDVRPDQSLNVIVKNTGLPAVRLLSIILKN